MIGWLLVLVLFLWITGGFGWVNSYEAMEEAELTTAAKAITMVTWPLMAVIATVSQVQSELRSLMGSGD